MPIENHLGVGTSADFFYPSFFSSGFYSSSSMDFKTLAPDYCAAVGNNSSACNTYANHYDWAEQVLDPSQNIDTARFGATSEMPEGTSKWYQVMNPTGKGVGLQAQLSIQDSYDGAGGSTTRDDQQSYLGVMINTMDKRSNDTTKYSAGDTGQYIDGTHYWSYQKRTNQTNDGLGVQLGVSPIECASSSDRGCLIAENNTSDSYGNYYFTGKRPIGMMVTTSDPYKTGPMSVGVKYDTNSDTWGTDTFNQMAITGQFHTVSPASLINSNPPTQGIGLNLMAIMIGFNLTVLYNRSINQENLGLLVVWSGLIQRHRKVLFLVALLAGTQATQMVEFIWVSPLMIN